MTRANEIAQGLRHPSGALTFTLDALEYSAGMSDFEAGNPPPAVSSPSYDLGRARAVRAAERQAELLDQIAAERQATTARVRAMLADFPEALADYDADMAKIQRLRKEGE